MSRLLHTSELLGRTIKSIRSAQEESVMHREIYLDAEQESMVHEFLFFVKPEITVKEDGINLSAILEFMFDQFQRLDLRIKNIHLLGAAYLDQYNIIAQHYGVINSLSRKPLDYFSTEAMANFKSEFGIGPDHVNLLGSIEFLHRFPEFTSTTLDELWQQNGSVKLAGGTYCAEVTVKNSKFYLINGFHPRQLIHFTEKGRSIVAFTLTGNMDWSVARNKFIGKTNPAEALPGSLRNELLLNQDLFGLKDVSSSRNGFHLSAGPVEGLVELIRYNSDYSVQNTKSYNDFVFGRQLERIFDKSLIAKICSNIHVIHDGKKTSVFDLTEEKNSDTALDLLKESVF